MPIDWGSRYFNRPGQTLENPAHLDFLKQPVLCSNSPLHKLYVVVKCSSQIINIWYLLLPIIIYYLQKCTPNVVCYFWSPCRTSYSSKRSFFFTFTLLHLTHVSSSNTSLHLGNSQMPPSPWTGTTAGYKKKNYTSLRIDTTQNIMRKPQTALKLPENF